ncbi:MAG: hypothetical protein NVSMB18_21650 [Acetobacteraceae bacterium]
MVRRSLIIAAATALLVGPAWTAAQATTVSLNPFQALYQGVGEASATVDTSQAYVIRIDLTAPGIGFTTTPKSGPLETIAQTTSQFLRSSGTQVAINAGFFDPCCTAANEPKNIEGLAISNGNLVSPDQPGRPALLLTQSNQARIASSDVAPLDLSGVFNAVSGSNILVSNGLNVAPTASTGFNNANPRSAVGLTQSGAVLFLVAIDGRQPGYSDGTTLVETADLLVALGAYSGLNLDGGGSTALAVSDGSGGARDLNRPSGGTERYDGNSLGLYALAIPEPGVTGLFLGGVLAIVAARRRFGGFGC